MFLKHATNIYSILLLRSTVSKDKLQNTNVLCSTSSNQLLFLTSNAEATFHSHKSRCQLLSHSAHFLISSALGVQNRFSFKNCGHEVWLTPWQHRRWKGGQAVGSFIQWHGSPPLPGGSQQPALLASLIQGCCRPGSTAAFSFPLETAGFKAERSQHLQYRKY